MSESVYEWKIASKDKGRVMLDTPLSSFLYALKSTDAKRQYPARLKKFFDFIGIEVSSQNLKIEDEKDLKIKELDVQSTKFLNKAKNDSQWVLNSTIYFIDHLKKRLDKGEITAGTIKNYYRSIKLFCEMNDLELNWKKVIRGMPKARNASNDRTPTIEEIKKLIEYPDRRIKPIVCVMMSSGIRLGAWDYLKWGDIEPLKDENEEAIIAAKVKVYGGEVEEYFTFITPEAYFSLKEWIDFRVSYGEKITKESWVMRDIWQTTNVKYGANWGLATLPKKLESIAIKRIIDRALRIQGIRTNLQEGQKRHEFKAVHGFRKYFKSRAEQAMKPINVEILMGHSVGTSDSYYKPTEKEVLEDYLKAVDLLVLNSDRTLKMHVQKLEEQNKNNEYIIKGRLQEKDEQIKNLTEQFTSLKSVVEKLASGLGNISDQNSVNDITRSMYISGMLKPKEG